MSRRVDPERQEEEEKDEVGRVLRMLSVMRR